METLELLSKTYGSGNLQQDGLLLALICCFVFLVLAVILGNRAKKQIAADGLERISGLAGRLEKIEMTLNAFRSESLRSIELFKGDVGFLKQEIKNLKRGQPGGPSGGGSGGEGQGGEKSAAESETLQIVDGSEPSSDEDKAAASASSHIELSEDVVVEAKNTEKSEEDTQPLSSRLKKTRFGLFDRIKSIFASKPKLDPAEVDEIEAQLINSDLGARTVLTLISQVKTELAAGKELGEKDLVGILKTKILNILEADVPVDVSIRPQQRDGKPLVVLMVGVNGVGKTTTSAKLASMWKKAGSRVLLVAADTFRAAAVEQLCEWGRRLDVPVVHGAPDAKPQTVVFEAMKRSTEEPFDVILIDTAGRLHTKSNLMQELESVRTIVDKHQPGGAIEVLLVVDGSTGQNALSQAREFNSALTLSGLVVTKLDGTPKGGIVVAIKDELGVPVRYIGVGESANDLRPFQAREFVNALFDEAAGEESYSLDQEQGSAHAETRRRKRREQVAVV